MNEADKYDALGSKELEQIKDTQVSAPQGVAAIALGFALKYHNINTVQDGALYQQYKLEGKNMVPLHLDMVFETAMKMEMHLMGANERIAKFVVDAIQFAVDKEDEDAQNDQDGDVAPVPAEEAGTSAGAAPDPAPRPGGR